MKRRQDDDQGAMKIWSIHVYGVALYGPRFKRELARSLGVSERVMRRWAAGDSSPPESILEELRRLVEGRISELRPLAAPTRALL